MRPETALLNVTLRQLRALSAVARHRSFTDAAKELHLSQSAVSALIRELEDATGVRLLERSTRTVTLTDLGLPLRLAADRILSDLADTLENVRAGRDLEYGLVKLAAPQLMACTLVPDAIAAFFSSRPGIEVELHDCPADDALSRVVEGVVDIAIGPACAQLAELRAEPFADMLLMFACRPDHPLGTHDVVSWRDVVRHDYVGLSGNYTAALQADLDRSPGKPLLRPAHIVSNMTTALGMVRAGLGATALPAYAAPLVKAFGLRLCSLRDPVVMRRFYIFTPGRRHLSPAADAMRAFLLAYRHPVAHGTGREHAEAR